jgi:hypothetical protein
MMNISATRTQINTPPCLSAQEARTAPPAIAPAKLWCKSCAQMTWTVTPEEAQEITDASPSRDDLPAAQTAMIRSPHVIKSPTGAMRICLKSLYLCLNSGGVEVR